jgi:hypothetical protein
MVFIVWAIQYFPYNAAAGSELLFYLVTTPFAKPLCHIGAGQVSDKVSEEPGYAVEHVLTYPEVRAQVPYNQQIE